MKIELVLIASLLCFSGCQSLGQNAASGGALGGLTGGLAGAAIGATEGKAPEGALIGAVTGATMEQLPSGYGLMFPALSSESLKRFTGGVILERVGVEPDIEFDFEIPYCGGNDRLLQAAIDTADEQIEEFLDTIL